MKTSDIIKLSVLGFNFEDWIEQFNINFKKQDGTYNYMAYFLHLNNPAAYYIITENLDSNEANQFLNELLTPTLNSIVIVNKGQKGGCGKICILFIIFLLFISSIDSAYSNSNFWSNELKQFNEKYPDAGNGIKDIEETDLIIWKGPTRKQKKIYVEQYILNAQKRQLEIQVEIERIKNEHALEPPNPLRPFPIGTEPLEEELEGWKGEELIMKNWLKRVENESEPLIEDIITPLKNVGTSFGMSLKNVGMSSKNVGTHLKDYIFKNKDSEIVSTEAENFIKEHFPNYVNPSYGLLGLFSDPIKCLTIFGISCYMGKYIIDLRRENRKDIKILKYMLEIWDIRNAITADLKNGEVILVEGNYYTNSKNFNKYMEIFAKSYLYKSVIEKIEYENKKKQSYLTGGKTKKQYKAKKSRKRY